MRALILIFSLLLSTVGVFAGNGTKNNENTKLISGKIIDKQTHEEIAGAAITIAGKTIYSDLNGNFLTSIEVVKTEAKVNFVSYNEAHISINPHSFEELIVELEAQ